MGYTVTSPLVVSKDDEGRDHYAYEGQPLPKFVEGDQLKRFVDEGLVEKTEPESDETPKRTARKSSK